MSIGALSPERKQSTLQANKSPTSRIEVKNPWNFIRAPLYVFMVWCLDMETNAAFTKKIYFTR
jgi:hypothetical protein